MFHVTIVLFVLQNFAAVWALKREILANRAGQKEQVRGESLVIQGPPLSAPLPKGTGKTPEDQR